MKTNNNKIHFPQSLNPVTFSVAPFGRELDMPTLDHATFIRRLKGKSIDTQRLHSAYPDLNLSSIGGNGAIDGTMPNLERLWEIIDNYDHDGNVNTISDQAALAIAEWLFANTASPAVPEGEAIDWRKLAELGDRSITDNSNAHKTAIENTGVGLYYGDHSPFHDSILRGDHRALKAQIDAMSLGNWRLDSFEPGAVVMEDASGRAGRVRESSCIGWVIENVKGGVRRRWLGGAFRRNQQPSEGGGSARHCPVRGVAEGRLDRCFLLSAPSR